MKRVRRRARAHDELAVALAPFWEEGEPDPDGVLRDLAGHGWTRAAGGTVALSDEGRVAHERMAARIDATRAVVLKGLTPDQYTETVRVLSVMAGNVEAELAAHQ